MFKYVIKASMKKKQKPFVVALTSYKDLAEFIEQHAVEALDPDNKCGLTISIETKADADKLIYPPREKAEAETDENDDLPC